MKVRLTRKFANLLNGIDLSRYKSGDTIDMSARDAEMLMAEGWAEAAGDARERASDQPARRRKKVR